MTGKKLKTYEVLFSYIGASGKKYTQSTTISECENIDDAKQTVSDEIKKRGLDIEKIDFIEVVERTDEKAKRISKSSKKNEPEEAEISDPEQKTESASNTESEPDLQVFDEEKKPADELETGSLSETSMSEVNNETVKMNAMILKTSFKNGKVRELIIDLHVYGEAAVAAQAAILENFRSSEVVVVEFASLQCKLQGANDKKTKEIKAQADLFDEMKNNPGKINSTISRTEETIKAEIDPKTGLVLGGIQTPPEDLLPDGQ